jgi:hypothetical protein
MTLLLQEPIQKAQVLTQKLPVTKEPGDLASQYLAFVEAEEISISDAKEDDVLLKEMVN